MVPALVAVAGLLISLGLTLLVEDQYYGLSTATFGDFSLHPSLMGVAFLLLAPLGASAFALGDIAGGGERIHAIAKAAHALFHLCALGCSIAGAYSMWRTHENSIYKFHFQTLHSWLGVVALGVYVVQLACGATFYLGSRALRSRFVVMHATIGRWLVSFLLLVCILGSLATVWKPREAEPHPHASGVDDWALQNAAGLFMLLGAIGLHMLLERRARIRLARAHTKPFAPPAAAALSVPLLDSAASIVIDVRRPQSRVSWRLWMHVAIISTSGLLLGYDLCIIASVLTPVQRELELCPECVGDGSDAALASCSCAAKQLAVSACHIGAVLGSVLGGALSDRFGRRTALIATDIGFAFGSAAMAAARTGARASLFFFGRAIAGLALGAAGAASSAFLAEISPPPLRGTLVTLNEVMLCLGCLVAYVVAIALGDEAWRVSVGAAGAVAALQLLAAAALLEESPHWLAHAQHGHAADHTARRASARSAAITLGIDPPAEPAPQHQPPHPTAAAPLQHFLDTLRRHRRPLSLCVGIALCHGITGANAVLYYSRDVLQLAGLSQPRLINLGVGITKFIGALSSMALVDRIGRRALLLLGSALMCAGHSGLAIAFWQAGPASASHGVLALASLLLFIYAWNLSWAGLMLTVASEILPQPVRGLGLGLAYALYWLLSFAISQTLESTFETVGEGATFALYGVATAAALGFVYVAVPETASIALNMPSTTP